MHNNSSLVSRVKELILPYLLCASMNGAIFYLFTLNYINFYWIMSLVGTAAMFWVCSFMKKHKIAGTILYLLILAITSKLVVDKAFELSRENYGSTATLYFLLYGFTFFNSSVVFYFSDVLYRAPFLILAGFIPCAFYVTVEVSMPLLIALPIIVFNLALFLYNRNKREEETVTIANKKAMLVGLIDFLVAAVLLGVIIPKPTETFYDGLVEKLALRRSLFMKDDAGSGGMSGGFNKYSGNSDSFRSSAELDNILLYTVYSDKSLYLKRQVFDVYLSQKNCWTYSEAYTKGRQNWEKDRKKLSYADLIDTMKKADEYDDSLLEKYGMSSFADSNIQDTEIDAKIVANDFPAAFVLHTDRTFGINIDKKYAEKIYRNPNGEIFTEKDYLDKDANYLIKCYKSDYSHDCSWIENGGGNISLEDYGKMLYDIQSVIDKNNGDTEAVQAYYNEYLEAVQYYKDTYTEPSAEIKSLAQSITAGCTYDWEKAYAIESYLSYSGGYSYDLDYRPPAGKEDIEYFIFNSKRGTCSDFATAFALMARSVGLPVRYVEGFTTEPSDVAGVYYVYGANSHAYCEAFIAGYGWMTIEATASSDEDNGATNLFSNFQVNYGILFYVCVVLAVIIVLGLFFSMFHKQIFEAVFRIRVHFADSSRAVLMLYDRTVHRTKERFKEDAERFTPDIMTKFALDFADTDITLLVNPFVKVCYGKQSADKADKNTAYNIYKLYFKNTRRKRR